MKRRRFVWQAGLGMAGFMAAPGILFSIDHSFINKLLPAPLNGGFYLPNHWICRLSDEPILQFGQPANASKYDRSHKHVEDPFIWWAGDHYELIISS